MVSGIVAHWRKLNSVAPPVIHPDDRPILSTHDHTFNLDYPPPAYIGDVANAPVVVLYANGGYDPIVTPKEFRTLMTPDQYIEYLHNPTAIAPRRIAPYYAAVNFSTMIEKGVVALVNAVAYRSPRISNEPENRKVAERLPSVQVHRKWLRREILPDVRRGVRLLLVKRGRLWGLGKADCDNLTIINANPISPHLPHSAMQRILSFVSS